MKNFLIENNIYLSSLISNQLSDNISHMTFPYNDIKDFET